MPTYEVRCPCGHAFELFRWKPITGNQRCPKCAKRKAVIQLGGGAAAMCKGNGFYSTDNRTDGYKTKHTLTGMEAKHSERMSKAGMIRKTRREDG